MVFNAASQTLWNPAIDWKAAGFVPGGTVFTGGSGLPEYWYANHDKGWEILSIDGNSMRLSGDWNIETNQSAWAPVIAGVNAAGIEGVTFLVTSGKAASNCSISGNTFSNLFGCPITLYGDRHVVANNKFTKLQGDYGIRPNGSGHLIYSNLWVNCDHFLYYSPDELQAIPHPPDASWNDYQSGFIHTPGGGTNVQFFNNWLENVHNPLGQINELTNAYGFVIRNNVFVGIGANLSGGRNGLSIESNTFYRAGYDWPVSAALTIGGNSASKPATNIFVRRNVFVDVGSHRSIDLEGYYSIVNVVESDADFNFVAAPETLGWSGKRYFVETNGINGGDPVFLNPENPRGPDGIPFTDDDGLKPLPNSPVARLGLGALTPVKVAPNTPISYFSLFSISSGFKWYDRTGLDFDPAWKLLAPFDRKNKIRPYQTAEALGHAPVMVEFSARNSISGMTQQSMDWAGITQFHWDFGDGVTRTTGTPTVAHTFERAGQFTVRLTVMNSSGFSHSSSKTYRVLEDGLGRPRPPRNVRLVRP